MTDRSPSSDLPKLPGKPGAVSAVSANNAAQNAAQNEAQNEAQNKAHTEAQNEVHTEALNEAQNTHQNARQTVSQSTPKNITQTMPKSDVSPMVGILGILGLIAWVVFCRYYGVIANYFDLQGPHQPLSGPHASLAALVACGGPMVLWSIFVDKVHRNPSTGIDWENPRRVSEIIKISLVKMLGLWVTWAIIGAAYCLGRWYWTGQYEFAMEIIGVMAIFMAVFSLPYLLWIDRLMHNPRDYSWHFGAMIIGRGAYDFDQVKKHWRSWIIKGFFGAFMISILPGGFSYVVTVGLDDILSNPVRLAQLLIEMLFVIDVQLGTVGYLLTMRPLDAHIRSGNPLLSGWVAALICYPPMVHMILGPEGMLRYDINVIGWGNWMMDYPAALWMWGMWLVFLTGVYAWATAAFGIRFSNLTYRGVITNGPYRFTRHPAYVSKNAFWWCATLPFIVGSGSMVDIARNSFFLFCISAIYFWRAKTEEAHLLMEDEKYREYHAWMDEHGVITSRLKRISRWIGGLRLPAHGQASGQGSVQPAE